MISRSERWSRVPVVWLGAAILFASIAGCIGMVVLASRYPNEPSSVHQQSVLKVPEARGPEAQP
ncbi:MAG TPA: hypothetical protein VGN07_12515 [Steroidobacteraceae bacterium]|jgi:hypothetical protein